MTHDATFGQMLRRKREERGIGLRRCAEMMGVSSTYLSRVETDKESPPTEARITRIAEILDVDRLELMALTGRVSVSALMSEIAALRRVREIAEEVLAAYHGRWHPRMFALAAVIDMSRTGATAIRDDRRKAEIDAALQDLEALRPTVHEYQGGLYCTEPYGPGEPARPCECHVRVDNERFDVVIAKVTELLRSPG